MTGGEHMARLLRATGLYTLPGDSPADWELDALAAGLDILEEAVAGLEEELFLLTAPARRLAEWEKLFRSQSSGAGLTVRRMAAAKALGARFERPSLRAIQANVLPAAGVLGTVQEEGGKLAVSGSLQGVTLKEAKRLLDRLLPAHMEWELTVL